MVSVAGQPRFFQRHFVIVVEIVDTNDRVTAGNQALGAMHAYKTGSPCQKNFHVVAFKTACRLVPPTDSTNRWCCLYSRTADWHKTDKSEATIRLGTTMKGNHRDIAPDLD